MMFTLGNFIGPTASGFFVEAYGFEWTSVVFCGITSFLVFVNAMELIFNLRNFQPGPDCESKCVCFFMPQGVSVISNQDNETTHLIYKSKDP